MKEEQKKAPRFEQKERKKSVVTLEWQAMKIHFIPSNNNISNLEIRTANDRIKANRSKNKGETEGNSK